MNRRWFLKLLGIGASVATISPEVLADDRLKASRMPSGPRRPNNTKATGLAINPGESLEVIGEKGSRKIVRTGREA
jgi:hypothetical protein